MVYKYVNRSMDNMDSEEREVILDWSVPKAYQEDQGGLILGPEGKTENAW